MAILVLQGDYPDTLEASLFDCRDCDGWGLIQIWVDEICCNTCRGTGQIGCSDEPAKWPSEEDWPEGSIVTAAMEG